MENLYLMIKVIGIDLPVFIFILVILGIVIATTIGYILKSRDLKKYDDDYKVVVSQDPPDEVIGTRDAPSLIVNDIKDVKIEKPQDVFIPIVNLNAFTKAELINKCSELGITVPGLQQKKKAEIIEIINLFEQVKKTQK